MTTQSTAYHRPSSTTTTRPVVVGIQRPAGAAAQDTPETSLPCLSADDPDLWFAERTADVEAAKAACGPCPLREACLAGAIERSEPWGVWGGQVFVDGEVVAVKRGRGRPRKYQAA